MCVCVCVCVCVCGVCVFGVCVFVCGVCVCVFVCVVCVFVCVCVCVVGNKVSLVEIATSWMVWHLNPSRGNRISFLLQNMQVSGAHPGFCSLSTPATFWV